MMYTWVSSDFEENEMYMCHVIKGGMDHVLSSSDYFGGSTPETLPLSFHPFSQHAVGEPLISLALIMGILRSEK